MKSFQICFSTACSKHEASLDLQDWENKTCYKSLLPVLLIQNGM